MPQEIERKFLVANEGWRGEAVGIPFRQGYLSTDPERSVRVRIEGDEANIAIKGKSVGAVRAEFEYGIPLADATEMLDTLCKRPLIEKLRYTLSFEGHCWEIDVFTGDNAGLVVAEVELEDEHEAFEKPDWAGQEVTDDPRYFNVNLVDRPYGTW